MIGEDRIVDRLDSLIGENRAHREETSLMRKDLLGLIKYALGGAGMAVMLLIVALVGLVGVQLDVSLPGMGIGSSAPAVAEQLRDSDSETP
jgi:hypothetical protein